MKDFENLTPEEQTNVIMQIGSKLTGQEVWYWEGIIHKLRTLQEENEDLREENKEAHDFDETMKDIKDNLIARINRQECEIHNLKAKLEMYENGVYFSSENDELQERIYEAIELIKKSAGYKGICTQPETDTFSKLLLILQGSDKE